MSKKTNGFFIPFLRKDQIMLVRLNYVYMPLYPTKRLYNLIQTPNQQLISTSAYSINIFNGLLTTREIQGERGQKERGGYEGDAPTPIIDVSIENSNILIIYYQIFRIKNL